MSQPIDISEYIAGVQRIQNILPRHQPPIIGGHNPDHKYYSQLKPLLQSLLDSYRSGANPTKLCKDFLVAIEGTSQHPNIKRMMNDPTSELSQTLAELDSGRVKTSHDNRLAVDSDRIDGGAHRFF